MSSTRRTRRARAGTLLLLVAAGLGCSDLSGLAGKVPLPSGIPDPNTLHNRAGALAVYQGVIASFQASVGSSNVGGVTTPTSAGTFVDFVLNAGMLTDELESGEFGGNQTNYSATDPSLLLDTRQLLEGLSNGPGDVLYTEVQGVRNGAHYAIESLAAYDTIDSPALRGQMYALAGYSELFLADLYCAGVPLSTLDFNSDFTYHAGSTTAQLYQAAIAQFDTTLTLSHDSSSFMNLALVGKGRAYLALGQYDSAAAAVSAVPTPYTYQFQVDWSGGIFPGGIFAPAPLSVTVADTQGVTGLPYVSSQDPRTASQSWGTNQYGVPQYAPAAYGGALLATADFIAPVTVASGIEARLIQAEAAYHGVATGTGDWLAQLNALRQTAITPALPVLNDPGSDTGRVTLIFRERAFWLFLTGHRQGDLRRLIRNYGRPQDAVYPTGRYPLFGSFQRYGTDVNMPIPTTERSNPLFHGCFSRGA